MNGLIYNVASAYNTSTGVPSYYNNPYFYSSFPGAQAAAGGAREINLLNFVKKSIEGFSGLPSGEVLAILEGLLPPPFFFSHIGNRMDKLTSQKPDLLLVIGMHRSGTSTLSRALGALGCAHGEKLLPPASENEKGFWEDADIMTLDQELLEALGSDWSRVAEIETEALRLPILTDFRARATQLLAEKLCAGKMLALKEPRMTLLLPFWQEIFRSLGLRVGYLLALRHPLEVARSLLRRNGFSVERGLLLWYQYNRAAWNHSYGEDRLVIPYDRLLAEPESILMQIAQHFQIPAPDPVAMADYVENFLDPALRHHRLSEIAITTLPEPIAALYTLLRNASDNHAGSSSSIVHSPVPLPSESELYRIFIAELEGTLARLHRQLADQVALAQEQLAEQAALAQEQLAEQAALAQEQMNRAEKLERLQRQLADQVALAQEQLAEQAALAQEQMNRAEKLERLLQQSQDQHVVAMETATREWQGRLTSLSDEFSRLQNELTALYGSRSWRITKPLRLLWRKIPMGMEKRARLKALLEPASTARSLYHKLPLPERARKKISERLHHQRSKQDYAEWIRRYDTLNETDRAAIQRQVASWEHPPLISVVMPVYNTPEKYLEQAIDSVREQLYPHWELCIVDDASPNPRVRKILKRYAQRDPRIKVAYRSENGHISVASNDALAMATGDYIALLDHDDTLAEHALYWVASEIVRHPDAELIYSDEDKIDEKGRRCDPYFKPDWNPELLLGQNYISHLGVYKRERVLDIGEFRPGFEGSQDWDLVLRFTDDLDPAQIRHIPAILYHWRMLSGSTARDQGAKPYVVDAAKRAITETLERRDEHAILDSACNGVFHLPRFTVYERPLVSIIIPTRNGLSDLRQCLDSLSRTSYPNTEILIIDNQSDDPETLTYLSEIQRRPDLRVLSYPYPFDYAGMHNWAVPQSHGEYICLLNNDTEAVADQWLTEMLGQGQRRGIGAVGAKLLYPDGTIQHGGVILGVGGIAGHVHKSQSSESPGYFGRAALVQSFSAVTAACLLMKKDHWNRVGGMAQELSVAFNDVDLCLRLREAGLRNVWVPQALLYHHESKSRGSDIHPDKLRRFALEHAYMQWRWGLVLRNDPAYNPNLTLEREDFSLAWPPRVHRPWRSECIFVEIPYGLPHANSEPLILPPGGEISGSFAVPVGTRGSLKGISLLIGNYAGASNGSLVLRLQDAEHQTAHAHSTLSSSLDNAMLPLTFSHSAILLHGQERLFFRLRLEGATHPVAIWTYLLDERWGHQIAGHKDRALRIVLQVVEDDV